MGDGIVGGHLPNREQALATAGFAEPFVSVPESCYQNCDYLRGHLGELALESLSDRDDDLRALVCDDLPQFRSNPIVEVFRGCHASRMYMLASGASSVTSGPKFGMREIEQSQVIETAVELNGRLPISRAARLARR